MKPELVDVSSGLLVLCSMPLLVVIYISSRMHLNLERPMIMGTIRTFVQLSILGFILQPIFERGETCPWLVLAYTIVMVLIAAYESMHRSRYQFSGMFVAVLISMAGNVLWVSLFAFCVVLQLDPLWDPQYVIPIVGMLLGNSVNGIALALNHMLTALKEQASEIELYLAFGATPREASNRLLKEAVRVGAMPQLNSMAMIGIINIPGMMTGQILGGTSVVEAARYQILIMYLIVMCAFGTILTEVNMALKTGFDGAFRLQTKHLVDKRKAADSIKQQTLSQRCCSWLSWSSDASANNHDASHSSPSDVESETTLLVEKDGGGLDRSGVNKIEFHKVLAASEGTKSNCQLQISDLEHSIDLPKSENHDATSTTTTMRRLLFENLSLELNEGEMTLVTGPSGAGKSTFLRIVAGLEPVDRINNKSQSAVTALRLETRNNGGHTNYYNVEHDKSLWRRQVRYVAQNKVDMPGSPKDFIRRITSFQVSSNTELVAVHNPSSADALSASVAALIESWGMKNNGMLESSWSTLSGGEAQRVMVAIGVASRPRILLLDESTSALDLEAKKAVERSILQHCREYGTSVLWVTHDPEQMERLANS